MKGNIVMQKIKEKLKLNKVIFAILGIAIIISVGVNIYFYPEMKAINNNIASGQTQIEIVKNKNAKITSKTKNDKQSLTDIQKDMAVPKGIEDTDLYKTLMN